MEQLERDDRYAEYHEPKVPFCFLWLYNHFIELYNFSGESVTWTNIQSYCIMRNIKFTQIELDYILKMIGWSSSQMAKMRNEQE